MSVDLAVASEPMTVDLRLVLLGVVVGGLGSASFFRARTLGLRRARSVRVGGILLAKLLGVIYMCVAAERHGRRADGSRTNSRVSP